MTKPVAALVTEPSVVTSGEFLLLFAVATTGDAVQGSSSAATPIPTEAAATHLAMLNDMEQRLLGDAYLRARRIRRQAVMRLTLPERVGGPARADVYRVDHKAGVAVWEVVLPLPPQTLDVQRWIEWLRLDAPDSLAAWIWKQLAASDGADTAMPELYLPLCTLAIADIDLDEAGARYAADLVRLLHLDLAGTPFKPDFVAAEMAGDFCFRDGGLSLLSRRAALDVRAPAPATLSELPRSAQPFLITLELLVLERAILRQFNDRLAREPGQDIDALLALKREVLDGLEEYYGTLATGSGFSVELTSRGEALLGIENLHDAVVDRLDMVTFSITTRYQRNTTRIGVWLTVIFGAIETGFVASSIATWHYRDNLGAVLGWTIGMTLATALLIALLLYPRTR